MNSASKAAIRSSGASVRLEGCQSFRQRIVLSVLSGRPLLIAKVRERGYENPGLRGFEAGFLRLVDKVTNGSTIEINETGTVLRFLPGMVMGGKHKHDCGTERSIGYFLEGIVPLIVFGKQPTTLDLTGITNDCTDMSVDSIHRVMFPYMRVFGIGARENDLGLGVSNEMVLKVRKRGARPNGGGEVHFECPIVRQLKPVRLMDPGMVKRIRGVAFSSKVSPQMVNRVVEAARGILNSFIPDVFVHTDHRRGAESGESPGYGATLVAKSTTGVLIAAEAALQPRVAAAAAAAGGGGVGAVAAAAATATATAAADDDGPVATAMGAAVAEQVMTPEDIGKLVAARLLEEIRAGGCVDSSMQPLIIMLMALGPEDVSKVRLGSLSPQAVRTLRLLKEFLGVVFKIKAEEPARGTGAAGTVLLSCQGCGFKNTSKKVS